MRTKKELLELLLAEWEKNKRDEVDNEYDGLCFLIVFELDLTFNEESLLRDLIKNELTRLNNSGYLFKEYLHQPRVEWLKKQIELCEKK